MRVSGLRTGAGEPQGERPDSTMCHSWSGFPLLGMPDPQMSTASQRVCREARGGAPVPVILGGDPLILFPRVRSSATSINTRAHTSLCRI